jgi:transcriptional regulator with XRE-family HTH domain
MVNYVQANLSLLRKGRKLTQEEAATGMGFKRTTYSNYENGHTEPDIEALQKISSFHGISIDDLVSKDLADVQLNEKSRFGENVQGNVQATVQPNALSVVMEEPKYYEVQEPELPVKRAKKQTHLMPRIVTMDSQGNENAVYVPVKARAGYLLGYGDPAFIEKLPAYRLPGHAHGTYRIFEVDGVSMFNTLQDKDRVVARWTPVSELRDDRVHVLLTKNDGIIIKRVLNRLSEGKLVCKSDNNHKGEYPNIVLDIHEVLEAWYVVERWTRQLPSPGEIYKRIVDLEADMAIIKRKLLER